MLAYPVYRNFVQVLIDVKIFLSLFSLSITTAIGKEQLLKSLNNDFIDFCCRFVDWVSASLETYGCTNSSTDAAVTQKWTNLHDPLEILCYQQPQGSHQLGQTVSVVFMILEQKI